MEVKGNVVIHGSYIDIHDNKVVNLSVDKAQVNIDGEDIRRSEDCNEENSFEGAPAESPTQEVPRSVKDCFRYANDFVREQVADVVRDFYLNTHVNLALIEVTLFDHGLLRKRNSHTAFVSALVDWGILPDDIDMEKAKNGVARKFRDLPLDGYKQWGELLLNERNFCMSVAKKLDATVRYSR